MQLQSGSQTNGWQCASRAAPSSLWSVVATTVEAAERLSVLSALRARHLFAIDNLSRLVSVMPVMMQWREVSLKSTLLSFFTIFLSPVYGEDIDLRLRFKRREPSRSHVGRFVPPRLKLSANAEGGLVSGYLKKKQRGLKWKRSYFVLKDRVLYTYKASEDTVATDTLPVLGWSISLLDKVRSSNGFWTQFFLQHFFPQRDLEAHEGISSANIFKLTHQGSPPFFFAADNENSAEKWRRALRDAVAFTWDHRNHDDLDHHQRDYFQYCKLQYRLNLTTKRFMQPYVILVEETLTSLLKWEPRNK